MINSLLLCVSSYNKNKLISYIFTIIMIINLLINQIGKSSIMFISINIFTLLIISILNKRINNNIINTFTSIFSILIYSIIIDIICFYMYPVINTNLNIISYIFNGILFNFKYVLYNISIIAFVNSINFITNKIKLKNEIKKEINA